MMIKIGKVGIGKGCPTFIIAEIGATHDGKIERVFKLSLFPQVLILIL